MNRVEKAIYQLTNVEILDKLSDKNLRPNDKEALTQELTKRALTKEQLEKEYRDLQTLIAYRQKRQSEPLQLSSKLTCILLPFYLTRTSSWDDTAFGQAEIDRWNDHGFRQKFKDYWTFSFIGVGLYALLIISFTVWLTLR